eukprot:CAMPEP_0202909096 /NCGR_PEP_ID=MMETSP1392-20130828/48282_1 /ASSEMBLY_ACC=CAM_ASM_000868 /TAXON_ID=225041 /ORGANISM="Chlamydomonas chlamydogama, Strain SAG 11-48b" /LENGTH=87 /DNA_ID=CAMNT_0049598723 /DNA_START=40 /DNA_END=300 /DNA_ORIENTATION=+
MTLGVHPEVEGAGGVGGAALGTCLGAGGGGQDAQLGAGQGDARVAGVAGRGVTGICGAFAVRGSANCKDGQNRNQVDYVPRVGRSPA